jgi:hypothetical protein
MIRFKCFTFAASVIAAAVSLAAGENWPQWRGPGSQGISNDPQLPTEWGPNKNIAWKTELPAGHSSPIVWGNVIFLTAAVAGDVVPGAKAVTHLQDGKEWLHPDSVAADRKHAMKVLALDARTGKVLWADRLRGHGVRRAPSAQQLRRPDRRHRWPDGVRVLRS